MRKRVEQYRERPETIGMRLFAARQLKNVSQKELADDVGCTPASISQWECDVHVPNPMYRKRLCERLGLSMEFLLTGREIVRGRSPSDHQAGMVMRSPSVRQIDAAFREALSGIVGEDPNYLPWEMSGADTSDEVLSAAVAVCSASVNALGQLTSSADFKAAAVTLDEIMRLGKRAYARKLPGAGALLFDAADKAVRFRTFTESMVSLKEETDGYLLIMSLVADAEKNPVLKSRFFGRVGDVLSVWGSRDPDLDRCALEMFRKSRDLGGNGVGGGETHTLRSPVIVMARTDVSRREFEKSVEAVHRALESGHLTTHKQARCFDGLCQAYAYQYQKSGSKRHRDEALNYLDRAQNCHAEAEARDAHVEYSLRADRLPIAIAQSGVWDHLETAGLGRRARIEELALNLLSRANHTSSVRVVEEMTRVLIACKEL